MSFTPDVLIALAGPAASAILLGFMLVYYLPAQGKRHQQTIERIIAQGRSERSEDHQEIKEAILKQTRAVTSLSRVVLMTTLMNNGMGEAEAEREACRIITNGTGA